MDLLKQCQQWFEKKENQKVIDAIERISAEKRTPELDSELAKAYIAIADIGENELFEKAMIIGKRRKKYRDYPLRDQTIMYFRQIKVKCVRKGGHIQYSVGF